jgi:hypothetical protein
MNKQNITNTINYTIQEQKEKKENRPKILQERNYKLNCLKNLKKQFFSGNLILSKQFWFRSGKNNQLNNKMHKNTFSDIQSFNSFFNYNYNLNYNSSNNSNTTANTHNNNSNRKSNSFQKCTNNLYKINLKTLSRKKSLKQNYLKKNECPIKYSNRINKNNSKTIDEERKNLLYSKNNTIQEITTDLINNIFDAEEDNTKRYNNIKYSEEYSSDILNNLLQEEKDLPIQTNPNYYSFQYEINDKMRAILIDWLIDVHYKFGFKEETLYITIYIIDSYLSLKQIERCNLQLLGITALFIACKQNEIIFRRLKEYAYITDNAYTESDIITMENIILRTLNFNLLFPSALSFYEILCNNIGIKNSTEKFHLGEFLIQSFIMDSKSLNYTYSAIACASAYIVMKFFKMKNYQLCYDKKIFNIKEKKESIDMTKTIDNSSSVSVVKECAKDMCFFVGQLSKNNLRATIKKFDNKKYGKVSELIFGSLL